ncbi:MULTISPECIES: ParB/RepB/Spo0J family partition protein [Pseudomonas]|uniref:ParB/RepB/Spo0J family partition protein n=1 Tax=Pseudomonas TaxID=286 RepID=UPI001865FE1F|nr:ParB N-terminal domain-containing protein [Pseudomonas lundensis]
MKTEPADIDFDFHPLANLFPLMGEDDLAVLTLSIQENGQRDPIVIYEGKILDGRNRFRALKVLNLHIDTQVFEGEDPVGYVADHNLHRRHLKASQRAAVAALLSEFPRGRRRTEIDETSQGESSLESGIENVPQLTQVEAAHKFGVSQRLVAAGTKVKKTGHPDLINMVRDGKVSIESAVMLSDLPMESQEGVLNSVGDDFRKAIKELRSHNKLNKSSTPRKVANQGPQSVPLAIELIDSQDPPLKADPLTIFFESLIQVGGHVLSSGFDAEEWFTRHAAQMPSTFAAEHERAVMSALGVLEQLIDHVQAGQTN